MLKLFLVWLWALLFYLIFYPLNHPGLISSNSLSWYRVKTFLLRQLVLLLTPDTHSQLSEVKVIASTHNTGWNEIDAFIETTLGQKSPQAVDRSIFKTLISLSSGQINMKSKYFRAGPHEILERNRFCFHSPLALVAWLPWFFRLFQSHF